MEDTIARHLADGRLARVLANWCSPSTSYCITTPAATSRRRLAVLVEALRYKRGVQKTAAGRVRRIAKMRRECPLSLSRFSKPDRLVSAKSGRERDVRFLIEAAESRWAAPH